MSHTIQYDTKAVKGSKGSKGKTDEPEERLTEDGEPIPEGERLTEDGDLVPEGVASYPLAQTGTLDTSDNGDVVRSIDAVTDLFNDAHEDDEYQAAPEGTIFAPVVDPAATGEDALLPVYEEPVDPVTGDVNIRDIDEDEDTDVDDRFRVGDDPINFTVPEINEYLIDATPEERERVFMMERRGKNRSTVGI